MSSRIRIFDLSLALLPTLCLSNQPKKINSFHHLSKKPPREKRKGRKEKGKKKLKENQREKEKEKREKGGEVAGSQGKGERGTTAARRRRRKAPQATPGSHEPPSQPPSSVTR